MRRAFRSMAVVLLLLAAFDLLVPGVCVAEDLRPGPDFGLRGAISEQDGAGAAAQGPLDDCYCCCGHILPDPSARFLRAELPVRSSIPLPVGHPRALGRRPFHPPRA